MAFSKGNESTEGAPITRYTGVASVFVRGVNFNKSELEKFFERDIENEPVYVGESDNNGVKVPQVRLDFMVEADKEKYGIDFKSRVTLFLRRMPRVSKAGKKQVIDKYGRTAWATEEEIASKSIPVYSNGKPANIDKDYRVAYSGEEDLINFLIAYLNIPSPQRYVNGDWVMNEASKLPGSEAMLEHIEDYFKGDFKEIKTIVSYQPNNKVKVLFGVRTADDGKQYQTCYTRMFLKNSVNDYSRLDKNLQDTKASGALSSSEFDVSELHEYKVEATDFTEEAPSSTPWD